MRLNKQWKLWNEITKCQKCFNKNHHRFNPKGFTSELAKAAATEATSELDVADEAEILQKQIEKQCVKINATNLVLLNKNNHIANAERFSYDTIQSYLTENEISFEEEEWIVYVFRWTNSGING